MKGDRGAGGGNRATDGAVVAWPGAEETGQPLGLSSIHPRPGQTAAGSASLVLQSPPPPNPHLGGSGGAWGASRLAVCPPYFLELASFKGKEGLGLSPKLLRAASG